MTEVASAPRPTELVDTFETETVLVCGVEVELREFSNATRAHYLEHAEAYDMHNITRAFVELQQQLNEVLDAPTRVKVQKELIAKLETGLANKLAALKPEKYTAEMREQLNQLADDIDAEKKTLRELEDPTNLERFEATKPLDKALEELKGKKRELQLRFIHKLSGDTGSFEAFAESATGSDYAAAEEVITAGNEPWLSQTGQPKNRAERRKTRR